MVPTEVTIRRAIFGAGVPFLLKQIIIRMDFHTIEIQYQEKPVKGLPAAEKRLLDAALSVANKAYAPYSGFRVGAVAVLADGTLVEGNNQENQAYPSGLCAERVALFYAGACYPRVPVVALVIVALREDGTVQPTIAPCGACRQVLLETEQRSGRPIQLWLCGCDSVRIVDSAAALLPLAFGR
jgi:cytidine deaminase